VLDPDLLNQLELFVVQDFLDASLCARLRSEARTATHSCAGVIKQGISVVDEHTRKTKLAQLSKATRSTIEERLTSLMPALEQRFSVTLTGYQPPQFLVYKKNDYFKIHSDNDLYGPEDIKKRQISALIFLSNESREPAENSYSGGTLTFYRLVGDPPWGTCQIPLTGQVGSLVAFRSTTFHEVSPVINGERYTIVTWFT
jgi:predicted 2-oxoglutarate/Fe(II)-dependent dioxygenase YbiX